MEVEATVEGRSGLVEAMEARVEAMEATDNLPASSPPRAERPKVFVVPKIQHQVARLTVDTAAKMISGRTDIFLSLKDLVSEGAAGVRLHCAAGSEAVGGSQLQKKAFEVKDVTLGGESVSYSCAPASNERRGYDASLANDRRKESVHSKGLTRFADELWHRYNEKLAEETTARFVVDLSQKLSPSALGETGAGEVACLSIQYVVSFANGQALSFDDKGFCFTGSHFMPTKSWLPCVEGYFSDSSAWVTAAYPLSLELRVDKNLVVVSSGKLLSKSEESGENVYKFVTEGSCPLSSVCFAVGPMRELEEEGFTLEQADPKRPSMRMSFFAEESLRQRVKGITGFLKGAMERYLEYLEAPFPLPRLSFCFLPPACLLDDVIVGSGVILLSSDLLMEEKSILGSIESRTKMARAVADQWFGHLLRAASVEDRWLVTGLSGLMTSKYVSTHFGENEALYQWSRKLDLVVQEQDEASPSLYDRKMGFVLAPLVERYTSNHVLKFKTDLLVWMVENRTGVEPFQKVTQNIVSAALKEKAEYFLAVETFFDKVAKVFDTGVDRKWLQGFNERWVIGRGCPHIYVAFCFNRKHHSISVALKQRGLKSANVSGSASVKCCGKEGSGLGMIALVTGETDGIHKNKIFLGDQDLVLEDVKCQGKLVAKKRKRKDDKEEPEEKGLPCGPVNWLGVHHNYEWFASFEVSQPEKMWISQLESSKSITLQLDAISGLVHLDAPTYSAVNALNACVRNKDLYHRVRSEAALALARTVGESTNWTGINTLLNLYREIFFNPDTYSSLTTSKENALQIADQLVSHSASVAIGLLRDEDGLSPQEATDFLLELLKYAPHDGIAYSVNERITFLLKGIGVLAIDSKERLEACLKRIRTFLQRDQIFVSDGMSITCACLQSICSLLIEFYRRNPESDCGCMDEYLFLTKSYTSNHHSGTVRTVANICVVLLESIRHGCKRAFQSFLDMLEDETSSYVKMEVTEKVKESFVLYRRSMHEPLNTGDILDALELCLDKGSPIQLSYKLFEFVQLLGKRPLSLHRASEEALHREFFVKLQREHSHLQVPIELERRAPTQRPRPSKMTVDIPVVIEADEPPSPCLRSFTMESGHTFQVGQRVKGKWRNGPDWYGGSITKIHQSGTFDILYDDGDLETDVPIVRMIPEGGWQFTSASAQELVTDAKKSSKKSKIDLNQLGDADAKSLYAKLVSETSKEKPLTEEEKKQKLVEELMRLASKILNGLRSAKAAAYFMNPVSVASFGGETQEQKEKAFEEYLKVIEGNPMDLGTVTEKTRGAKYESPLQFRDDVRQIFINSRKFNVDHPESIVYKAGEKLSETFETKWKESHIEELWEAGEIRSLTRVESRAHTLHDSNRSQSFRGKVKFEDEQTQKMWGLCLQVLREVKTHPNAWPFLKPVDPEKDKAPDYFEVVKEPMDFNTVTDKLARRVYENVSEFKSDMELVFKNCRLYNKVEDNAVRKLGDDLEVFFKLSWDKHDIESKLLVENKVLTKEDEMMKECDRIVHFLKKHKYAEPFLKPVTQEMLQLPELWAKYQDVVKTPMDISTIASKQRRRKYSSIDEFKDDVNLVFENCFKFNFEGDPVHKAGKHLKRGFRKRWKKLEEKFGIERLKPDLEAWKRVEEVVSKIFNNDLAISFRAPVDKISVPDYYDVIKTPIDLGAIQSKVHNKEYASPVQVKEDMDLLFANCRQYNKEGDPLSTRGEELNKVFGELWSDAKIEALMAESACVSGEDSLAATLSEGGTLVPETTLLTNDSGQSQDTSKHHAEVLSKEKPLHGVSPPVKMEIDDVGAGGHETAEGVRGGGEGMEIDQAAAPDNSNGFPKIRLKSLPPKKVSLEIQGESDNPGSSQVHVVKEEAQLAAQGDAGFTPAQFQECLKLIFMLKKNKVAEAFVNPVTADTFGDPALWGKYQQIVTKPMDLTTIHNKLKSKEINAPKDLWEDVTQIFENCYRFNYAVDPVFVSAKELQRVFMKRWGGFERKFALEPQAASILEDIFSSAEVFLRSLVDHESYASLKTEVAAMDGIGFDFGPIARKLKTREYKEPTQVRDDLRFQFQALLREVEGNDLLHSKVEDFQKVFHGLWEEGEFEKKFSRCVLKSESPKKIHREARKSSERVAKAYPSQGDVKAEHAPSPPKEKPSAPTGGLTLKIKFGAPKQ